MSGWQKFGTLVTQMVLRTVIAWRFRLDWFGVHTHIYIGVAVRFVTRDTLRKRVKAFALISLSFPVLISCTVTKKVAGKEQ